MRAWPFLAMMISMLVFMPTAAAIRLETTMDSTLIKDHGKWRYTTRNEEIRNMMHALEKRGLFAPPE
jgi:hypothetical protein